MNNEPMPTFYEDVYGLWSTDPKIPLWLLGLGIASCVVLAWLCYVVYRRSYSVVAHEAFRPQTVKDLERALERGDVVCSDWYESLIRLVRITVEVDVATTEDELRRTVLSRKSNDCNDDILAPVLERAIQAKFAKQTFMHDQLCADVALLRTVIQWRKKIQQDSQKKS
jgi:hypothetical protein